MCDQLRGDYLSCAGHPDPEDAEHRRAGRARRALHPRLRAVADLRPLAHELLHRPLHALARRALERLAAARRRTDAGRLSAKLGVRNALVGKTHMAPDLEGMKGLGIDPDSIIGVHVARMRLRALRARRRPASRRRRPRPALQRLPARAGLRRPTTPGSTGPIPAQAPTDSCRPAGCCAMPQARAREGGAFRDALHDAPRHGFHRERSGRRGRGACISPTSSRTGPTSRPRPTTACTAQRRAAGGALGEERRDPHPVFAAFMDSATRATWRATRRARR